MAALKLTVVVTPKQAVLIPTQEILKKAIPPDVQHDLVKLAVLREQILRSADAYKALRAEIDAKLAATAEVRS